MHFHLNDAKLDSGTYAPFRDVKYYFSCLGWLHRANSNHVFFYLWLREHNNIYNWTLRGPWRYTTQHMSFFYLVLIRVISTSDNRSSNRSLSLYLVETIKTSRFQRSNFVIRFTIHLACLTTPCSMRGICDKDTFSSRSFPLSFCDDWTTFIIITCRGSKIKIISNEHTMYVPFCSIADWRFPQWIMDMCVFIFSFFFTLFMTSCWLSTFTSFIR